MLIMMVDQVLTIDVLGSGMHVRLCFPDQVGRLR